MAKVVIMAGKDRSLINFRGELIKKWIQLGHQVVAAAPRCDEGVEGMLHTIGATYKPVTLNRTDINPLDDLRAINALHGFFKTEKPDKVLLYTIKPVIYGSIAASLARVPEIYSMITGAGYVFTGNTFRHKLLKTISVCLYRKALSSNKRVFFQNPDDINLFKGLSIIKSPDKTVLINGSGVCNDHYYLAPIPQDNISFLLIARLIWDKGIREYVEAARLIKKRFPGVSFRLLGRLDSNPASLGKGELDAWQEEGIIEYLGYADDVRPYIADSSVYVLPSYREGTPRTVLEAMSMGRPIITTDAPGCRETVEDGLNGFLVPIKDSNSLAGAMERFINEPGLISEMGNKSREIAVNKYDVHKVNGVVIKAMGLG